METLVEADPSKEVVEEERKKAESHLWERVLSWMC